MSKESKVSKNKYVVIKKGGKTVFSKKATCNMVVFAPDSDEVKEKTSLTSGEKKVEKINKK